MSRREFLQLAATSTTAAVAFTGCLVRPGDEVRVQSPAQMPEDLVVGLDAFYATVCRQCPAGCGILVRVMAGRAKKVEGNPDFPVNLGKHSALGEAALQALYHPDRLRGPLRRRGERGAGSFEPISWDEALNELTGHLRRLRDANQGNTIVAITEPAGGHASLIVDRFVRALGGQRLTFEPFEQTVLREAIRRVYGQEVYPSFDVERTRYLLSFGADFLGTWLSPVQYGVRYGAFRQGQPRRGVLVQVEPRFSPTAANADSWVPIRPGAEGILALSLAQVIVAERLGDAQAADALTGGRGAGALDAFAPARVADQTGVPADRIAELARAFAGQKPSLAIGGGPAAAQTNGLFNLSAVYALNYLVGSVGAPGGVIFNPPPAIPDLPIATGGAPLVEWQRLGDRMRTRQPAPVNLALVHGANPVHGLPVAANFMDALASVPTIISFSRFLDETTALADVVLPDHTFLEDWGDDVPNPGPGFQTVGFQQPVVRPFGNTRGFADVLLAVGEELGLQQQLPWNSLRDAVRDSARQLQRAQRGSVSDADFERFWVKLLQRGGWWDARGGSTALPPRPPALPTQPEPARFSGDAQQYPFHLIVFPSTLHGGELAHLPWLQALPDPVTTATWQTWVEINPRTAERLRIGHMEVVTVESERGSLEAPAYVNPAAPPDIVAMPAGQGHQQFTRYAQQRGVNPLALLAPTTDAATGALAWAATRVRVRGTGRRYHLATMEGNVPPIRQLEDAPVVPVVPPKTVG
ncbi:MAG: molybdopterin-dependent oxidoreductase [Chloroflexi bacterium]|nr:molybdopterin-dependent oxidoreductase [Chloroflexota bacterium]